MTRKRNKALIYFVDGSQQEVWNIEEYDHSIQYEWEHDGKELRSLVPYTAIKRVDYIHED